MDIKTIEQALKMQNDLTSRLTQSLVAQRSAKAPTLDAILKNKEQLLISAQAEVEKATSERDAIVSNWNARVTQRQTNVTKLQSDINDIKDQLSKQNDPAKNNKAGTVKKNIPGKG